MDFVATEHAIVLTDGEELIALSELFAPMIVPDTDAARIFPVLAMMVGWEMTVL